MIIYLAGKMTGCDNFNYPAFHEYARRLRAKGYTVRNPAEEFDGAQDLTRSEYMKRAHVRITTCGDPDDKTPGTWFCPADAIALLPLPDRDAWRSSDGAHFEMHLALIHDLPVYYADDLERGDASPLDRQVIRDFVNPPSNRVARTATPHVTQHVTPHVTPGEVRIVDPKTGGEKGRKPQRYSLVPMRAWQMILNATTPDEDGEDVQVQAYQALAILRDFIQRDDDDDNALCCIGDRIVNALGGTTAALEAVSEVYHYGSAKYKDRNWERGYDWSLSIDSCYRHLVAVTRGQMSDPESGLPELAHALFHVLALLTFLEYNLGTDDRSELYKGGA